MQSALPSLTPLKTVLAAMLCVTAFSGACASHTVIVPAGQPVRLRETLRNVKVWVADAQGREVEGVADLAAGWYCLPDPGR